MALTISGASPVVIAGMQVAASTAMRSIPIDCILSAAATANTANEILRPLSVTNSNNVAFRIGYGSKLLFRVKYSQGESLSTNPIIQVFGIFSMADNPAAFADDGTVEFCRLDALSGVAGITLAETAATDKRDTTWRYSDWQTYTSPYTGAVGDAMNAGWGLVLLTTAGIVSGAGTASVEVLVI